MTERPGYRYVAPSWSQVGNQWRYVPSRWDRNGDGVPDRYQAQRPYGDRDRDGIPNKYDRTTTATVHTAIAIMTDPECGRYWDNRRR